MKRLILLSFVLLASLVAVNAQDDFSSSRLNNFANDLKRVTVDLVDRTSSDIRRSSSLSRTLIEEAFVAAQLDSSAGLFQDMVNDRRRAQELRDAAAILTEVSRRAPTFGSNNSLWRSAQTEINNINRELGGNVGGGGGGGNTRPVVGRVFWRGMVDDKVQLVIRDRGVETQIITGNDAGQGTFNFTSPLPPRNVRVEVEKVKGRGNVRVLQQPNKANDFTAIVEIFDNGGGAREYELDIYWR